MFKKYIVWDWRLLPLIGTLGLIVSAIALWENRWADALALGAILAFSVSWSLAVHDVWKDDKEAWKKECEELAPLKMLDAKQRENEWQWLHPVTEYIDLNRNGLPQDRIMIKYQIDSGLTYDFKPHSMWIKLRIGEYEETDWHGIKETRNLLHGGRSHWASEEIAITDARLLEKINLCRSGKQISQTLKIAIQTKDGEPIRILEPVYSINPHSDYVTE